MNQEPQNTNYQGNQAPSIQYGNQNTQQNFVQNLNPDVQRQPAQNTNQNVQGQPAQATQTIPQQQPPVAPAQSVTNQQPPAPPSGSSYYPENTYVPPTNPTNPFALSEYSKIGGALLAFIIMQAIYVFFMLAGFPDALENFLYSITNLSSGIAGYSVSYILEATANFVAIATLIAYSIIIIASLIQLITRNVSFLRFFQIAGLIAAIGNFVVFVLKEIININYMYSISETLYSSSAVGDHWALVMLALLWTIFWTLYFVRAVRIRTFMSPQNPYSLEQGVPYIDRALFGKGMKG